MSIPRVGAHDPGQGMGVCVLKSGENDKDFALFRIFIVVFLVDKEGLPPLSRRQFCKWTAVSSILLGMPLLSSCEIPDLSPGECSDGNTGECDYIPRVLGQDSRADISVRPGVEIDFYGDVPFRTDLRYTDFSKVGLSNLITMASVYHNHIQNRNRLYQIDVHGHERTVDAESTIWGRNLVGRIHKIMAETLNLTDRNLESFMKQWQLELNTMGSEEHNDLYFEMPTRRRALVTVNRCTIARQYEELGREDELPDICKARCGNYIQNAAGKYSKSIRVKNLVMPPRQSEDHICCKWELYYLLDGSRHDEETGILIDPGKMDKRGELIVQPDVNLDDYSGPFRPDLRLTDFSRETLARMYLMYHQYDLDMIMGYQVYEIGQENLSAAASMQVVVWSNDLAEAARSTMMKYMKTQGRGIDQFLKALQVDITAQPPNFENEFTMPDENTGVYSFHKCFGLTIQEPISSEEQITEMCALDPPAIGNSCGMYSRGLEGRRIQLEIVTMPPRSYSDEICCRWKFSYVPADSI